MKDIIVEETRRIKQQIEKDFDPNTKKYLQHIYEAQKQHGDKLVCRQPKPLRKRRAV